MGTRPIAGASNWISTRASKWLSEYLLPHVKAIPTRVGRIEEITDWIKKHNRDVNHLSATTRDRMSTRQLVVGTADVVAMYPNINNEEGSAALRWFLQTRGIHPLDIDFIVKLAE